ncbi:MAG: septal ring lytic transglycosylase RlpA family protein [Polyangiaceae bacterium]
MFARRYVAPLLAVMVVGCASEPPRSNVPPARKETRKSSPSVAKPASLEPGGSSPVTEASPEPDSDALAERFQAQPALSRFTGQASYYSDALAGRRTASGEPYKPGAYTAAHRSLPFGSVVRVSCDRTGRSVYVRINDRGPFVRGRVLDLSRAAAQKLGLLGHGVLDVRAEVVETGPAKKSARRRGRRKHKPH